MINVLSFEIYSIVCIERYTVESSLLTYAREGEDRTQPKPQLLSQSIRLMTKHIFERDPF